MDLVEAVLLGCNSEEHLAAFKINRIEYIDLKLLTKEDLIYLGITDELIQNDIIKNCSFLYNLRTRKQFLIDSQYICLVANQISLQLKRHVANLTWTVRKQNVGISDVQLKPVYLCFQNCVASLDENINCLEQMIKNQKQKNFKMRYKLLIVGVIATVFTTYLIIKNK